MLNMHLHLMITCPYREVLTIPNELKKQNTVLQNRYLFTRNVLLLNVLDVLNCEFQGQFVSYL